jgi:Helicase conserved C-terminal domain
MSARVDVLQHVLAQTENGLPYLPGMNADALKRAARFWFGTAAYKFRKDECLAALVGLERDETKVRAALPALSTAQRQILSIFQRYGGAMSGALLLSELLARGIVARASNESPTGYFRREKDPVDDLCAKLVLVHRHDEYSRYRYSYGYHREYPDLALLPGLRTVIEAAAPLSWSSSGQSPVASSTGQRAPGEVIFDLARTAQALGQLENWATDRDGCLTRSSLNRLRKLTLPKARDAHVPPDLESLHYELIRTQSLLTVQSNQGRIDLPLAELAFQEPLPALGWNWVRTWLRTNHWQDGIGAVSARSGSGNSLRVDPKSMAAARELLAWALSLVAQGPNQWLELDTFLADFWSLTSEHTFSFYHRNYTWNPNLAEAQAKDRLPPGSEHQRAIWMTDVGIWVANAILVTFFHLGLVERGNLPSARDCRYCFRLTGLGRAVFGAPEIGKEEKSFTIKFLTVQPNHEIVAYLDGADPKKVWPLAHLTRPASSTSGPVRTLTLTRLSVYAALESGMPAGEIREFLAEHSKSGLPANVAQSLVEWTRKHEALVIRTGVTLQVCSDEPNEKRVSQGEGQKVGDHFLLLHQQSLPSRPHSSVWDHQSQPKPSWEISEEGFVRVGKGAEAVALARLSQFADPVSGGWQITAASVQRARERGIPVEQILIWIDAHQRKELPPLVEMAIRNWASPGVIFIGPLVMMQVPQPQAYEAIRSSERFRPLVVDYLPPHWFIIHPEKHGEVVQLLQDLGFTFAASFFPSAEGLGQAGNVSVEADSCSPGQRLGRKQKKRTRDL